MPSLQSIVYIFAIFVALSPNASRISLTMPEMLFLCPATKKVAGYYVIPSEILSVRLSVSTPTIRLPATPPTVLGQSFSNFTGAFRMVWRYAYCFFRILKLFFFTFFLFFNLDFFSSPNTTEMYREYVPCTRNSSYSFRLILLKLYRRF